MATVHHYPVHVAWTGGREGAGTVTSERSRVAAPLSVPPEFQGPGQGTNPEELLTSAIAGCYTITYGIIAQNRKVPVANVVTEATGEVEQGGASFTYTKIVLRPVVTLEKGATDAEAAMAEDLAHKADLYCIVTNAVRDKVAIEIHPTIVRS